MNLLSKSLPSDCLFEKKLGISVSDFFLDFESRYELLELRLFPTYIKIFKSNSKINVKNIICEDINKIFVTIASMLQI